MRNVLVQRAALSLPFLAATIHDLHIGQAIHAEQPEGVAGIPVVLITIEYNRGVFGDAPAAHQLLESLLIDEVTCYGVLYVHVPVELDRARNMTHFIEQYIFISLDQAYIGVIQMIGNPACLYQHFGMGIS